MAGLTTLKTVATISAISSTCQGLAWSAITLPAILCYACILKPDPITKTTPLTLIHYLAAYFQGPCNADLNFYKEVQEVTSPENLLVINIFFYMFNLLLGICGIVVLVAISTNRKNLIIGWISFYVIIGYCVCVIDFVASSFIASDYDYISTSPSVRNRGMAGLTLLSVFFFTCRGIFLWVANLFFYLYITACICKISCGKNSSARPETDVADNADTSIQFDRNEMEKPIEYIQKNRDAARQEYPEHCAYSRWPRLHPGNRIVQRKEQQTLQEELAQRARRYAQYQQNQMPAQRQNDRDDPFPPPDISIRPKTSPYPERIRGEPERIGQTSTGAETRPGSLQEAILTVRPLRHEMVK
ncbi:uncharacterized protein LOC106665185 isoform X2 [Cimex lectularius]|uniref:Uncharacterized protein n=1 Tax=Cimex lectularius TaxID=79782 RepID=A0A8I6RN30_CIMLE|nr:uncharacterized protein LOC106665185 isoform X2 [Cimex lectularius]